MIEGADLGPSMCFRIPLPVVVRVVRITQASLEACITHLLSKGV